MPILSDDEFIAQSPAMLKELQAAAAATPAETPAPVAAPVEIPPSSEPAPAATEVPPAAEASPTEATSEPSPTEGDASKGDETPPSEPDYKAVYERIFGAPIRAGGQDITLHDPDEVISLVQKGVGFHNKMNRLHGDLKIVEMLRNNNLLDESKLSVLIDANQGKPGAIKKLLDSAQVDPLTLDTAEASTYAPSDHRVTDEQVHFQTVVSDLSDSVAGRAVLTDAQGWDQASKAEIYKTPAALTFLADQKEQGRYDLIVAEVNRAKLLGSIPATEPFLQSYTRVGQQMMQAGKFGTAPTPTPTPTPTPVAQKIVTPPEPANSKKAAAAAPTRTTPAGSGPAVNINEMDDAAFEAHFKKTFRV